MLAAERGDGLRPELLVLLRHREAIAAAGSNVEEFSAIAPARRSRPDLMRRQRAKSTCPTVLSTFRQAGARLESHQKMPAACKF
jgi:hypothetical protein